MLRSIADIVHDEAYFTRDIEPHLDGERVRYVGSVGPADGACLVAEGHLVRRGIGAAAMVTGIVALAVGRGTGAARLMYWLS